MPFQTFDRNSFAFLATLAATLTLFASSLFYNRIEAPCYLDPDRSNFTARAIICPLRQS